MLVNYTKYIKPCSRLVLKKSISGLASITFVVCSIKSILFLMTAEIARASCLAKFSNPVCCYDFLTLEYSSRRERPFVNSVMIFIKLQKYPQSFILQCIASFYSSSPKVKLAISVKHLIASFREWIGRIKCWIKFSIKSVLKIKWRGIQERNA